MKFLNIIQKINDVTDMKITTITHYFSYGLD